MLSEYAKFWVALIGVAITTALGIIPKESNTTLWTILTILSAIITAALVYAVPNADKGTRVG